MKKLFHPSFENKEYDAKCQTTSPRTVQPQRCSGIHLCSTLRLLESPPRGHNRHHRTDHHSLQKQTNQSQIELVSSPKLVNVQIIKLNL